MLSGLNIYSLLSIVFICITLLIIIYIAIKKNVNIEFSKDKMMLSTQRGQYISTDKNKTLTIENERLLEIEIDIKDNQILSEQMKYLERQSNVYYSDLWELIPEELRIQDNENKFELHRLLMLDTVRDEILKKNHFLEKQDWDGYKKLMFQYSFNISCEIFIRLEKNSSIKLLRLDAQQKEKLEMVFGRYFYCWMDNFRVITQQYVDNYKNVKEMRNEIYRKMGFSVE